jgi:hypothetical protein
MPPPLSRQEGPTLLDGDRAGLGERAARVAGPEEPSYSSKYTWINGEWIPAQRRTSVLP